MGLRPSCANPPALKLRRTRATAGKLQSVIQLFVLFTYVHNRITQYLGQDKIRGHILKFKYLLEFREFRIKSQSCAPLAKGFYGVKHRPQLPAQCEKFAGLPH